MQRASGEPEGLRLQPGHAMARGDRIERGRRHARGNIEHQLVLHEARLAQRRQMEAVAQIGRGTRVGLFALITMIALLADTRARLRGLPRELRLSGMETR